MKLVRAATPLMESIYRVELPTDEWLEGIRAAAYLVSVLAIVHFAWGVKRDVSQPLLYALILAGLLAVRVPGWLQQRERARYRRPVDA